MHKQVLDNQHSPVNEQSHPQSSVNNGAIQAKHKPIQAKQKPIQAKQKPIQAKQRSIQAKQKPLQRQTKDGQPQGSAKFKEIATTMGEQHGVDTSSLKATHNSTFPNSVHAEATIQGSKIDFAPGKDTEFNMKHEVAHYIDNAKNGTPKGDKMVNGQAVDTTREQTVDKMAEQPLQRKAHHSSEANLAVSAESQVLQKKGLGGKGSDNMSQKAGTCGLYSLANAIAFAHNRLSNAQYRTNVKNKLLRIAGEQDALVTAQGELISYEDIKTIIDAYNADQDSQPNDPVRLTRHEAPNGSNAQDWRETIGQAPDKSISGHIKAMFSFGSNTDQQQAGNIIAVDWTVLSNYSQNPRHYNEGEAIPRSKNSSSAHWLTIVRVKGNKITLHNSHNDKAKDYPIWVVKQATDRLQDVGKKAYLQEVYDGTHRNLQGYVNNDAKGFIESNTRDWANPESNYPDTTNRDYETMSGEPNVRRQQQAMTARMERTEGAGAHDVRLRNLIIRVEPA
ncbi:MAG TPA: hypothetical protein DCS93_41410 [Microscillaceae bacterium]|nr:hypothetical protein [Microscillaceae bacterium]